jgi:L-amino acid N-acyltransferase YncA
MRFSAGTTPSRTTLDAKWPGHRWIAEVDGQVAGWAASTEVSIRDCCAGVAETSVYVGDGFRGQGVGKALLRKQVMAAAADGPWTSQYQSGLFPHAAITTASGAAGS